VADNYDKLWLQQRLNQHAINRAHEAIQSTGRALPCTVTKVVGSIVTVTFDVTGPWTLPPLTLPKAESQWLRAPTQVGDMGMTVPADTFLGGVSGLGTGVADLLRDYGNMSTLVWVPVASTSFGAVPVANGPWINGPGGAAISDTAQDQGIFIEGGVVTIKAAAKVWTFSAAGFTMATGIVAETHIHAQGPDSHGDTEQDTGQPIA
jgi:hypothetical protein